VTISNSTLVANSPGLKMEGFEKKFDFDMTGRWRDVAPDGAWKSFCVCTSINMARPRRLRKRVADLEIGDTAGLETRATCEATPQHRRITSRLFSLVLV